MTTGAAPGCASSGGEGGRRRGARGWASWLRGAGFPGRLEAKLHMTQRWGLGLGVMGVIGKQTVGWGGGDTFPTSGPGSRSLRSVRGASATGSALRPRRLPPRSPRTERTPKVSGEGVVRTGRITPSHAPGAGPPRPACAEGGERVLGGRGPCLPVDTPSGGTAEGKPRGPGAWALVQGQCKAP